MTENRYDDDILSAIIDGEATPDIVAAVDADPIASQRLVDLREAVDLVAAPVPEATPERRSASIAAAMAAATPVSPEVTSLSAKRHEKQAKSKGVSNSWLIAAAAAVILFVLAVPTFLGRSVNTTFEDINAELATGEFDTADAVTEAAEAPAEAAEEALEEETVEEAEEEAMADEEAVEEAATEAFAGDDATSADGELADADAVASAPSAATDLNLQVVPSIEELELRIGANAIAPELAGDDILAIETLQARAAGNVADSEVDNLDEVLATDVNPECVSAPDGALSSTPYALVVLDPFAGPAQLVIVEFNNDGTTRLLDAETCGVIG